MISPFPPFCPTTTLNQAGCQSPWDILGQASYPRNVNNSPQPCKTLSLWRTRKRGGGRERWTGIAVIGSGSWMSAKIKRGRENKIGNDKDPSLTFEKYRSNWTQKKYWETQKQQRAAIGEDEKRRGCSWHILQLLFLTAIRTCQSLSTCHSSVLIGGLSLQIAQIKIPHSWSTGLDPQPPHTAKCLPTQSPTLSSWKEEGRRAAKPWDSTETLKEKNE